MATQAQIEGRYLGGRPPYGYLLIDAGPHPNPAKSLFKNLMLRGIWQARSGAGGGRWAVP